jgi:hypothetical protein
MKNKILWSLPLPLAQKKLINRHLKAFYELSNGLRKPVTPMQMHFVDVCNGKYGPRTEYEIAYLAFLKACEEYRHQLKQVEGNSKTPPTSNRQERAIRPIGQERPIHEVDPRARKPWSRYINEPLGTREDFKRDSAGNRSRARYPK